MTAIDTYPTPTTVSLRVAQFIARHKPFVTDFNVPNGVTGAVEMPTRYRTVAIYVAKPI